MLPEPGGRLHANTIRGDQTWMRRVDWYNLNYGTDYRTDREMLADLYRQFLSCNKIASQFKECTDSITRIGIQNRLRKYGVNLQSFRTFLMPIGEAEKYALKVLYPDNTSTTG